MKKHRFLMAIAGIFISISIFFGIALSGTQHANLKWNGPQTCLQCHEAKAREVHNSVHYQWQGEAPYALNGPPQQGKLWSAVNSYCINILGNWNACGSCHAGLGAKPEATATTAQLQNIDCLVCHQKDYKRKKVNGVFVPDTGNMSITMDQAVQTVHKPTRENCLQCHARGGGGDNYKRGDLALAHGITSDRNFDVHMSKTGANLACQSCHTVKNHKIAGRGSDLRQTDLNVQMSCSTSACHPNKLSSNGHANADVNRHINKVACQTCHIKTFARNAADTPATEATEMHRDWFKPHQTPSGAIHPTPTLVNNVKPVYKFWNMYSYGYSLGEPISIDPQTGKYPTSRPDGGINDPASKLYPFKYKTANQPLATNLNKLIPLDTSVYFATGDPHAATKAGLVNMGASSNEPYSFIETDTYQLITHQVMPKAQALTCNQCHGATATQMNLKSMGYGMKASASSLCAQCHSYKDPAKMDYNSMHKKHVKDKKLDCSKCHNFTRVASATQYTLTVAKSGNGSGTVTSNPTGINCGSDCSENYTANTIVTLTASPSSGSTFTGWSEACSGGGTCFLTINNSTNVTATFTQSTQPTCSYTISPTSTSLSSASATGSVNITTQSGCAWNAASNASWITITSGSTGSGNGTLNYSVSANTTTNSRTGTLTIAGKTFTITQAGIAGYTLSGRVTMETGTPLSGVTITLNGSASASVKTDSNGNYELKGIGNGNYTITPTMLGYAFTPINRTVTVNNSNVSGLNFSGKRVR